MNWILGILYIGIDMGINIGVDIGIGIGVGMGILIETVYKY